MRALIDQLPFTICPWVIMNAYEEQRAVKAVSRRLYISFPYGLLILRKVYESRLKEHNNGLRSSEMSFFKDLLANIKVFSLLIML